MARSSDSRQRAKVEEAKRLVRMARGEATDESGGFTWWGPTKAPEAATGPTFVHVGPGIPVLLLDAAATALNLRVDDLKRMGSHGEVAFIQVGSWGLWMIAASEVERLKALREAGS